MRDLQLDTYRALVMIHIVCIIHVLYWLGVGSEPINSLLLFEMPVIFFISGAAQYIKPKVKENLRGHFWNRINRVLFPYYIYAITMLFLAFLIAIPFYVQGQPDRIISNYHWFHVKEIILCNNIPYFHYIWHLWFIPPYLLLSCTFTYQMLLIERINRWLYLAASIILFLVVIILTDDMTIRSVFCYNIFMVGGYTLYKRVNQQTIVLLLTVSLVLMVISGLLGFNFIPLQKHKFPPDSLFVLYGVISMCLLSLIFSRVTIPNWKIFQIWNQRGYTIYLYQSLVFFLISKIIGKFPYFCNNSLIQFLIYFVLAFVFSTILSYFTWPLESFVMSKIKRFQKWI